MCLVFQMDVGGASSLLKPHSSGSGHSPAHLLSQRSSSKQRRHSDQGRQRNQNQNPRSPRTLTASSPPLVCPVSATRRSPAEAEPKQEAGGQNKKSGSGDAGGSLLNNANTGDAPERRKASATVSIR